MKYIKSFVIIISALLLAHSAMAAFTSTNSDDNKNKYSLKYLNKLSRNYSSFSLRYYCSQAKSSYFYTRESNGLSMSTSVGSSLSAQKSNTTYIYPYKYTVKVPKFKTPVRPQQ